MAANWKPEHRAWSALAVAALRHSAARRHHARDRSTGFRHDATATRKHGRQLAQLSNFGFPVGERATSSCGGGLVGVPRAITVTAASVVLGVEEPDRFDTVTIQTLVGDSR
jgi:hypothetical protein